MKILAIETSCDETALALIEASGGLKAPKFKILKNIVSSQTAIHAQWGGVVPNLAKREHLKNLPVVFKAFGRPKLDLLAVTVGPGLEPALWTGVNFAKELHKNVFPKAKLWGVNHLEGHLYSFLLTKPRLNKKIFPAIASVVSGGHTILLLLKSLTQWKKLGETRDDAVGEVFDKVARMLHLPYPGGPQIQKLAETGNSKTIEFPRPMMKSADFDFSFSGLKTSVLYYLRDNPLKTKNHGLKANIAASFQKAAIDVLSYKTANAIRQFKAKSIMLSGGVAANKALREEFVRLSQKLNVQFFVPSIEFNTDNAVMIGVAAYIDYLKNSSARLRAKKNLAIRAQANLNL